MLSAENSKSRTAFRLSGFCYMGLGYARCEFVPSNAMLALDPFQSVA